MYIVIESFRTILKEYIISINLWDLFLKRVVYILNILISRLFDHVTSFEVVNKTSSKIFYLRTLNCRVFMDLLKFFNRQKIHDRFWKKYSLNTIVKINERFTILERNEFILLKKSKLMKWISIIRLIWSYQNVEKNKI